MKFYVSTYTEGFFGEGPNGSKGIYLCEYDGEKINIHYSYDDSVNPSFIKLSKNKKHLYAANEKLPPGRLDSYDVCCRGKLKMADKVVLNGRSCCYVYPDEEHGFVAAVHYGSGEVFTYSIDEEGHFLEETSSYKNDDLGPNKERQEAPHAHSVRKIEALDVYVACDLGCDQIDFYEYEEGGYFKKSTIESIKTPAGFGPRHTDNSKDGRYLYVTCELSNRVLFYELVDGQYVMRQNIPTIPDAFKEPNTCADIHISKDNRHLFVSNRGHDSIVEYRIDENGGLKLETCAGSGGAGPRNFALLDNMVICANETGNNVTILQLRKGLLTGKILAKADFISPVCIEIYKGEE